MQPHSKQPCMSFAGEDIGDEGAKQLAKSLANNTTLTSLNLRGSRWCNVILHSYAHAYIRVLRQTNLNVNTGLNPGPNTNANISANADLTANPINNPNP